MVCAEALAAASRKQARKNKQNFDAILRFIFSSTLKFAFLFSSAAGSRPRTPANRYAMGSWASERLRIGLRQLQSRVRQFQQARTRLERVFQNRRRLPGWGPL